MPESDYELLLPRLALHLKLLSNEQVAQMLRTWRSAGVPELGRFLEGEGYLSKEQVAQLRAAREEYLRRRGEAVEPAPAPSPLASAPAVGPLLAASGESSIVEAMARELAKGPSAPPAAPPPPAIAHAPSPAPSSPAGTAKPASAPVEAAPGGSSPRRGGGPAAFVYRPGQSKLNELLERTIEVGASDLHVHAGAPLKLRWNGRLSDVSGGPLTAEESERLVLPLLNPVQQARLEEEQQLDLAHSLPGVGRFRGNVYRQLRGLDAAFRAIPARPPTLEGLGLPASLSSLTELHQGLVLFTGPAGCGKSSTMAALVHQLIETRADHIITLEDPIEFVHTSRQGLVNQREVGPHTSSFARALRAALREDPDVIVIGELRDLETISLALTAAETGHLVLGTLHTGSALRTIHRLLGVFPPSQQAQIRTMVSESLRAVVSQRLVPRADGTGRVAALEVLIGSKAVGNLIRENKVFQIQSILQTGASRGMMLLDASLAELVKAGTISKDEAARQAEDPKRFA
ncbi:MAG TPA: type IV pilus twitching motility protein PilT [Thermoanaerobaculia bacterium]|nr:type IV pilus twitching motility protein PilT [Thermoanaerobaculia bacterium]